MNPIRVGLYQFAKGLTFKVGTHALMRPLRPVSISDG
jgi:hypothetical protein